MFLAGASRPLRKRGDERRKHLASSVAAQAIGKRRRQIQPGAL
jgi:hypothetical protein